MRFVLEKALREQPAPSLSEIVRRLGYKNFTGSGASLTGLPDHFNVYLGLAAPGLTVPISVFSDPNTPITAAAYWALMAPALQGANAGLSGLGCYGGVGAYMRGLGAYQW